MLCGDGLADVVRPPVDAQGGDATRIHVLEAVQDGANTRSFDLRDTKILEVAIARTDARLVVIDPLSAYLGEADTTRMPRCGLCLLRSRHGRSVCALQSWR